MSSDPVTVSVTSKDLDSDKYKLCVNCNWLRSGVISGWPFYACFSPNNYDETASLSLVTGDPAPIFKSAESCRGSEHGCGLEGKWFTGQATVPPYSCLGDSEEKKGRSYKDWDPKLRVWKTPVYVRTLREQPTQPAASSSSLLNKLRGLSKLKLEDL